MKFPLNVCVLIVDLHSPPLPAERSSAAILRTLRERVDRCRQA